MPSPRQPHQPDGPGSDTSDIMPPLEGDDDHQLAATDPPGRADGDTFLLLDLPPNSTIGCDAKAIGTGAGASLAGLRNIPGGAHLLWVSAPHAMSRCGYWFVTKASGPRQVRVKQWDAFNEALGDPPPPTSAVAGEGADVASLYSQLVPYGFDGLAPGKAAQQQQQQQQQARTVAGQDKGEAMWRRLTACVSEKVLARVITGPKAPAGAAGEWLVDTADGAAGDDVTSWLWQQPRTRTVQTPPPVASGGGELHFLFPAGDVDVHTAARTTTAAAPSVVVVVVEDDAVPDTSMDVLRLVDTPGTGVAEGDLVGELQLAFLTGLHLANLACIEQWWHLVLKVVLRAHRLAVLRPRLSRALLAAVHAQLVYSETCVAADPSAECETAQQLRHEYGGGPGDVGGATSLLLDVIPGNRRKLRLALALYKRRMNELLSDVPGGRVTPEQREVAEVFAELEEWFSRLGWDLKTGDRLKGHGGHEDGEGDEIGDDEDDEYQPVIVDLDGDGREVGLVSFN